MCFYMVADGSCINIYVGHSKRGPEEKDFRLKIHPWKTPGKNQHVSVE